MIILKNDQLEAHLHPKGAEIHKIIGLKDNLNYMWKRDAEYWANSAPILFPIVGKVIDNTYRVEGKEYHLTQHGFARHNEFNIENQTDTEVTFTLDYQNFLEVYPYKFKLSVTYRLEENKLACYIKVENLDTKEIYFGIGGHPAFACPMFENESSNDYYVEFEKNETLTRRMIDTNNSVYSGETQGLFTNEKRFFVRQEMFKDDAVVVTDFKSSWVALKSLNHNKAVTLHMDNFNFLGIWATMRVGGLLALEPWCSHADDAGFTGELKDKEDIVSLETGKTFNCCFKIEITQ